MSRPIVFFSRCFPQHADVIQLVREERRVFIGWPPARKGSSYDPHRLRSCLIDVSCDDAEWESAKAEIEDFNRQHTANRNLALEVGIGSIALVPRPKQGVVWGGRVRRYLELENNPPWAKRYLQIRKEQGLDISDEAGWYVADVAQSWKTDELVPIPYSAIPAWIRKSLLGRSTYGRIYPVDKVEYTPLEILSNLLDGKYRAMPWTTDLQDVEARLLHHVGPEVFEHLCVGLLQMEQANAVWAHIGGIGDGGVDGIAHGDDGELKAILQCKWRYHGEDPFVGVTRETQRILAALIHDEGIRPPQDVTFLPRSRIAELVLAHAARLPLALSLRIGSGPVTNE